jgi:hypothetical protein
LQSLSCTPLLLMLQGKLPISFKLEQLVIFIYYSTAFNRFDSTSSKLCGPNAKPQEHWKTLLYIYWLCSKGFSVSLQLQLIIALLQ